MTDVFAAVAALRRGEPVIIPTDTVYGLACIATDGSAVRRMYHLKGRGEAKPTALVAADVDTVVAHVPEVRGALEELLRAFLPGAVTFVVPNPARRFGWLTGGQPDTIGIRVPLLGGAVHEVVTAVAVLAATSANLPGGPDPCCLGDVADELRTRVAAVIDGGVLPGVPSTVIDATGPKPLVLRKGAVPASLVLEWLSAHPLALSTDATDS